MTAWPVPFCSVCSMKPMPGVETERRTSSAWCPTTTKIRSAGASRSAVQTTCSTSGLPPARCSTLARWDFMRVPSPAARITIVTGVAINTILWPHEFAASPLPRQLDRHGGGGRGIVPHLFSLPHQVPRHHRDAHFDDSPGVVLHRRGLLPRVPFLHRRGDGTGIDHRVIEQLGPGVPVDGANVVGGPKVGGFAGLRHQVDEAGLDGSGTVD